MKRVKTLSAPLWLLGLSLGFFGAGMWLVNQHKWSPLYVPIPLNAGVFRSENFSVDMPARYHVEIEVDRLLPFERLECLLGGSPKAEPNLCGGRPPLLNLSWEVYDQSGTRLEIPYEIGGIGSSQTTVSRLLGNFSGKKGQSYFVLLNLMTDATPLRNLRPHLVVREASHVYKGNLALAQVLALPGWGFGVVGSVWLLGLALRAAVIRIIGHRSASAPNK
jgi:hypothetical protein